MLTVRIFPTSISQRINGFFHEEPIFPESFLLWPSQWKLCIPFLLPTTEYDAHINREERESIIIIDEGVSRVFLIETPYADETVELTIDAHNAFGDGKHPTTELCIHLLGEIISAYSLQMRSSMRLIDVGTGSGILALFAYKCGIGHVDAIDIVDDAVQCATQNAAANQCKINLYCCDVAHFSFQSPYDIVTANLVTGVFLKNASAICNFIKPKGVLIASGISSSSASKVADCFSQQNLKINKMVFWKGWTGFMCTKLNGVQK
ncbi:MAG: 50S ribosomal protein L11 methyltransferase [Spirochaetes bacterium]|nr:50S ribosomal protein L11 methyltransferase [Spirochaetota bacterium]